MQNINQGSAMSVVVQQYSSDNKKFFGRKTFKEKALSFILFITPRKNALPWAVWVAGIVVAMLPVLLVPFVKVLVSGDYKGQDWWVAIFSQSRIMIVCTSLALMPIFKFFTGNQKLGRVRVCGIVLLVLTIICTSTYNIAESIKEYDLLVEDWSNPVTANREFILAHIHFTLFMLIISSGSAFFYLERDTQHGRKSR